MTVLQDHEGNYKYKFIELSPKAQETAITIYKESYIFSMLMHSEIREHLQNKLRDNNWPTLINWSPSKQKGTSFFGKVPFQRIKDTFKKHSDKFPPHIIKILEYPFSKGMDINIRIEKEVIITQEAPDITDFGIFSLKAINLLLRIITQDAENFTIELRKESINYYQFKTSNNYIKEHITQDIYRENLIFNEKGALLI